MDLSLAVERARAHDARRACAGRSPRFSCHDPVRAVGPLDPEYPPDLHLRSLRPTAPVLFVRGQAPLPDPDASVALIGTRRCSDEGRQVAQRLAGELARAGITVVSGLALGIDRAAHEGALDAGGRTLAVLASPVDVPTPRANQQLGEDLVREGSWLVSERSPGARVRAAEFPRRNRLVVGLCRAVIVVEAGLPSGTLGTVGLALSADRDVGCVPGSVLSPACAGSNALLQAGASPILSVDDALALVGRARNRRAPDLSADEQAVLDGVRSPKELEERWVRSSGLEDGRARAAVRSLLARGVLRREGRSRLARCLG